jgi:hypothetical protein
MRQCFQICFVPHMAPWITQRQAGFHKNADFAAVEKFARGHSMRQTFQRIGSNRASCIGLIRPAMLEEGFQAFQHLQLLPATGSTATAGTKTAADTATAAAPASAGTRADTPRPQATHAAPQEAAAAQIGKAGYHGITSATSAAMPAIRRLAEKKKARPPTPSPVATATAYVRKSCAPNPLR